MKGEKTLDITPITTAIGTLGFPIVCSGAMFWAYLKLQKQHQDEMTAVTTALNNNTLALQKIIDRLEIK